MEIQSVEAIPLSYQYADGYSIGGARGRTDTRATTLVRLETKCGTVGWGEAFNSPRAVAALVNDIFADEITGSSPLVVNSLAERVYTGDIGGYHAGRGPLMQSALAGVEIALWDLKGKQFDVPIFELFSGSGTTEIVPYASTMYFSENNNDISDPIRTAVGKGFTAVKIKIGAGYESDVRRVQKARELLPEGGKLMVDYNGNYTPQQAIQSINRIKKYDITWVEEPVPPENQSGYRELKQQLDIPLAAGEAHAGRFEFKQLIDDRLVDIIQPNVCKCGGFSEAMFLAKLATTENIMVRPHVWNSAVGTAAALQFAASVPQYPHHSGNAPEAMLFEFDRSENPLRSEIVETSLDPTGGSITVPKQPGLGIKVDEPAVEQYKHQ